MHRKGFENLRHGCAGRQLAAALLTADAAVLCTPLITGGAQLADDGLQLPMAGTLRLHGKNSSRAAGQSGRDNGDYFTATFVAKLRTNCAVIKHQGRL
jgi:hypothetical protein